MVQSFFRQILKAIGFMHSLQLTHTDLKPENILVCSTELVKTKVLLALDM
jgi:dual-specificity kinase